jgi:pyruvate,orthophosphate dikinase
MFFAKERITPMREMIMAETMEERELALAKLLPMQRSDFEGIFEAMQELPVTIRLLDPPLHEFIPHDKQALALVAKDLGISLEKIENRHHQLTEVNPMLGHRGCRLGNTYPEISRMQARAIMEAALNLKSRGVRAKPEIMVPLTGTKEEMDYQEGIIREEIEKVFRERGHRLDYKIGTMIEVPRAALTADMIAEGAEFFSFGTNDLTQMTYGFSRDDAGKFLPVYLEKGLLNANPFETLDTEGVGKLIEMAVELGRKTRPGLKIGLCGEQGGDPRSVQFLHKARLDYVSCSPYRVPIARLAAAQAAVKELLLLQQ